MRRSRIQSSTGERCGVSWSSVHSMSMSTRVPSAFGVLVGSGAVAGAEEIECGLDGDGGDVGDEERLMESAVGPCDDDLEGALLEGEASGEGEFALGGSDSDAVDEGVAVGESLEGSAGGGGCSWRCVVGGEERCGEREEERGQGGCGDGAVGEQHVTSS